MDMSGLLDMCLHLFIYTHRWLAVHVGWIDNLIVLFAVLFAVIERNSGTYHYDAALTALSITYALKVSG